MSNVAVESNSPVPTATSAENDWVARVLGVELGAPSPRPAASIVALQKARLVWDALRKSVRGQIAALEKALVSAVHEHNEDETAEDEYDEAEVTVGAGRLYRILDFLDERLIDKLDEALNADGDKRQSLQAEAAKIVAEYQAFLRSDPLLAGIDGNGFTPTTIRADVDNTLTQLARQL